MESLDDKVNNLNKIYMRIIFHKSLYISVII